jgi:hypothetical protein
MCFQWWHFLYYLGIDVVTNRSPAVIKWMLGIDRLGKTTTTAELKNL